MGLIAVFAAITKYRLANTIIASVLGFLWLWMGIVYNLIYFTAINKGAYMFGVLFVVQGILILYAVFYKKSISFRFKSDAHGIAGLIMITFALVVYPILGYILGHVYPASPTFGLPCPTTIFTLGILLWTDKRLPLVLVIIPLIWSIVGFSAASSLGMKEDISLLIAGVLFSTMASFQHKISGKDGVLTGKDTIIPDTVKKSKQIW